MKNKKIRISLCNKIILIIVVALFVCTCLWTSVMFFNISNNAREVALTDEKNNMYNVSAQLKDVEETCYLVRQLVLQKNRIFEYIQKVQNNQDYKGVEKLDFYKNEIGSIDAMVDINPYIYNVKVYANANVTEKAPSFYKLNRLQQQEWSNSYENNKWVFDYKENKYGVIGKTRLAAIIKNVTDETGRLVAVVEVSTELKNLFLDFDKNDNNEFTCFISNKGEVYASGKNKKTVDENINEVKQICKSDKNNTITRKFNGETSIVSTVYSNSLGGTYVRIVGTKKIVNSYYKSQLLYFIVVFLSMIVFIFIVAILIKNSFSRFNNLTKEVSEIKNGNIIKLTEKGNDEISELGKQINKMVYSLEKLNEENIERQLLAKNAEIRSLQNQINAHFMYNVLETIKMMAEIKEEYVISDAITTLGNMFRYSMKWSSGMVELKQEILNIQNYLSLMNLRQDYEIFLSLNVPAELLHIKMPKMSLQPIVENSVNHGIEEMAEDTTIYIKVFKEENNVIIEVSDMGIGMSQEKLNELIRSINSKEQISDDKEHGRALYNVQQRIKMYFGKEYGLQIFSQEGAYTKVSICIPNDETL